MEPLSRFNIKTKSGHRLDVVKSAIQKYARRGNTMKMFEAVSEMDGVSGHGRTLPVVKSVRTNMINRIKIILFEDVSYLERAVFVAVLALIDRWEQEGRVERSPLLWHICSYICAAKKARIASHVRAMCKRTTAAATEHQFLSTMTSCTVPLGTYPSELAWIYSNECRARDLLLHLNPADPVVRQAVKEWARLKSNSRRSGERVMFLVVCWIWEMVKHAVEDPVLGVPPPRVLTVLPVPLSIEAIQRSQSVRFDDFVYDIHTAEGRQRGKTRVDFTNCGALVENEDRSVINRELSVAYRNAAAARINPSCSTPTLRLNVDVKIDRLLLDGVCGAKKPCAVGSDGKLYKQCGAGLNYGYDAAFVDTQKRRFGLHALNIERVTLDHRLVKCDGGGGAKDYSWVKCIGQPFIRMKFCPNSGDLGKNIELLSNERVFTEMLRVRLFKGLFRCSDNNLRNILVAGKPATASDKDGYGLIGIDENDMFGKRQNIFNKVEPVKRSPFFTRSLVARVIAQFQLDKLKPLIVRDLHQGGWDRHVPEFTARIDNFSRIALDEVVTEGVGEAST